MWIVVVFEPRGRGEPSLSLSEQVQQVFGPFVTDALAEEWIEAFRSRVQTLSGQKWQFLVCPLDSPRDIPADPGQN